MKRILYALAVALSIASLSACQTPPVAGTQTTTAAPTFDGRWSVAIQEVTLARQASTQLAIAKKITWAQDQVAQSGLTMIRQQLESARSISITNPAQAAQLLADALNALAAYQGATK